MMARRNNQRGAALLVVIVSLAVLTIFAVQLAYETQISLKIAANARDDLRATYLAKSGVNLSRLVLKFQQDLDARSQLGMPRIQLWNMVPIGSTLAGGLFGAGAEGTDGEGAARASPAGDFEAKIEDEGRKVSAQLLGAGTAGSGPLAQAVYQLICDSRWDALFDREDSNGVRISRQDLLVHLHDWIDENEQGATLVASFPAAGCAMTTMGEAFAEGFQDENQPYDRGPDRYHAKNARIDSLDELYMIAGVGDAFMEAFGDELTVYLPPGGKRNVNETDRDRLLKLAAFIADPSALATLLDPKLPDLLQKEVQLRTLGGWLAMQPAVFKDIVTTLGVAVNQARVNELTDRSSVFGIRAQGKAGVVSKTLNVVVRMDDTAQPVASPAPGKLLHWREE